MTNPMLKNHINRYFDDRLQSVGGVEFDALAPRSRRDWPVAALAVGALVGVMLWQWPEQSSTLKDELLATTSRQSDADVFLDYQGRRFLYEYLNWRSNNALRTNSRSGRSISPWLNHRSLMVSLSRTKRLPYKTCNSRWLCNRGFNGICIRRKPPCGIGPNLKSATNSGRT